MSYIRGTERGQVQFFPPSIEEYVPENAPVRVVDAFVEKLDLEKLGFRTRPASTGRPGYAPADMLKLYIYGYLNRVRSSRRLEAESGRNLEVIWLLRGLKPDFKTIADFRREYRQCFAGVLREFNLVCRKLELFGAELVAIDGAKFKAVNSPKRVFTAEQLQELIKRIDEKIEEYLGQLETNDAETEDVPATPSKEQLKEKIERLGSNKAQYEAAAAVLESSEHPEIALTDRDSRRQKKVGVGYNVQVAVDVHRHLIAEAVVVQDQNDMAQLHPMAQAAQAALEAPELKVVADAGYHSAGQLEKCEEAKLTTYVPRPAGTQGRAPGGAEVFAKSDFKYDPERDLYRCPAGTELKFGFVGKDRGAERRYYYNIKACGACALRARCTSATHRKISRVPNEDVIERQAERVQKAPELVARRKTIVEHVFGTLRLSGHDEFLCRGLEMVRAEFSLSALSYNLRRALNTVRHAELMAKMHTTAA